MFVLNAIISILRPRFIVALLLLRAPIPYPHWSAAVMIDPDAVAMVTAAIVGPIGPVTGAETTPTADATVAALPKRTAPAHPAADWG